MAPFFLKDRLSSVNLIIFVQTYFDKIPLVKQAHPGAEGIAELVLLINSHRESRVAFSFI